MKVFVLVLFLLIPKIANSAKNADITKQNAHVSKFFYHVFLRFRPFWVFYFSWFSKVFCRKLFKSAVLISEFIAFPKAFSLVSTYSLSSWQNNTFNQVLKYLIVYFWWFSVSNFEIKFKIDLLNQCQHFLYNNSMLRPKSKWGSD